MQSSEGLHVLISSEAVRPYSILEMLEMIIEGGASVVQLRDKKITDDEFLSLGRQLVAYINGRIPLIVNDRVHLALPMGAQGVHVGQNDLLAERARKIIGSDLILGVSAQSVEQAILAQENTADYIGAGPVFPTQSKNDADPPIGLEELGKIHSAVSIPVIAIGGINVENAPKILNNLGDGIAVIGAIWRSPNPSDAIQKLVAITHSYGK